MTETFNGPFWLIAYDHYYPSGGLTNVRASFATMAEAEAELGRLKSSGADGNYADRYDEMYIVEVRIKESP